MEKNSKILLHGVSLSNYRGIKDTQYLGPLSGINILIGKNNAGKSIFLEYISKKFIKENRRDIWSKVIDPDEINLSANGESPQGGFGIPLNNIKIKIDEQRLGQQSEIAFEAFKKVYKDSIKNNIFWATSHNGGSELSAIEKNIKNNFGQLHVNDQRSLNAISHLFYALFPGHSGHNHISMMEEIAKRIIESEIEKPKTAFIPAIRQISKSGENYDDFSGKGLIDLLMEHQLPPHNERSKLKKFEKINDFLKTVTNTEDARIEIPYDRRHVLVHLNGKILPLNYLGTGIHEVIMLASFCTLIEEHVVCIEEPEIHLHPLLQRKFIKYLIKNTNNQYLIATHSQCFLEIPEASVFHVYQDDGHTKVRMAASSSQRFSICRDLGVKASDILQSNFIIWVEGPSDRIYINHWINSISPDLIEGTHYSIMFYGGRLLSHLDSSSDDVEEFINLRRLNQNMAIVMDSDKKSADDTINETKKRIIAGFDENHGLAWLTAGREIENYINHDLLQACINSSVRNYARPVKSSIFEHALRYYRKTNDTETKREDNVDKVKIARAVCQKTADLKTLDLEEKINSLVDLIRQSND